MASRAARLHAGGLLCLFLMRACPVLGGRPADAARSLRGRGRTAVTAARPVPEGCEATCALRGRRRGAGGLRDARRCIAEDSEDEEACLSGALGAASSRRAAGAVCGRPGWPRADCGGRARVPRTRRAAPGSILRPRWTATEGHWAAVAGCADARSSARTSQQRPTRCGGVSWMGVDSSPGLWRTSRAARGGCATWADQGDAGGDVARRRSWEPRGRGKFTGRTKQRSTDFLRLRSKSPPPTQKGGRRGGRGGCGRWGCELSGAKEEGRKDGSKGKRAEKRWFSRGCLSAP